MVVFLACREQSSFLGRRLTAIDFLILAEKLYFSSMSCKAAFFICWSYTLNAQQYAMTLSIHLTFAMVEILRNE